MPEDPKLDGRHHSDMENQNGKDHSVSISKVAIMASILKFFKLHLLLSYMPEEPKLDGRHHSDMENQNGENNSVPISKMATMSPQ